MTGRQWTERSAIGAQPRTTRSHNWRFFMKPVTILKLAVAVTVGHFSLCYAENQSAESPSSFETLLLSYIQGRLEQAKLDFERLTKREEAGVATLPQILSVQDDIDRWQLHLHLLTEGRLIAVHPVLTELRREFHVPELSPHINGGRDDAAATMVAEYLQKKLDRAERLLGSAQTLQEMGRATEADVFDAKNAVDAIKVLLESQKYSTQNKK